MFFAKNLLMFESEISYYNAAILIYNLIFYDVFKVGYILANI